MEVRRYSLVEELEQSKDSEITQNQLLTLEGATRRGRPQTEATRQKISAARKGKPLSEEHKEKLRQARLGKPLTPEHRHNIAAAHRGKTLSEEHKAKIGRAMRGRVLSEAHKQKLKEAKLGDNHWRWDVSFDKVCQAIELVVAGANMSQASLQVGRSRGWLATWKYSHAERYQALLVEAQERQEQIVDVQAASSDDVYLGVNLTTLALSQEGQTSIAKAREIINFYGGSIIFEEVMEALRILGYQPDSNQALQDYIVRFLSRKGHHETSDIDEV